MSVKPRSWEGDRSEAVWSSAKLSKSADQTGITFAGPSIFAALALALHDPSEQRELLAKGEAIIKKGCVGHNHLRFTPMLIEVSLALGDWGEAERYATAMTEFTRPEPLPWAGFFASRARVLAANGPRAGGCADAAGTPASQG